MLVRPQSEALYICKKCNHISHNLKSLSRHLETHDLTILEYYVKYENFEIPKCGCGENVKSRKGLNFSKTCGNKECVSKLRHTIKMSDEVKLNLSIKRKKFLKEKQKMNVN